MGGDGYKGKSRHLLILSSGRRGVEPAFMYSRKFSEGAGASICPLVGGPNPVPCLKVFHTWSRFYDCPGEIAAEDQRKWLADRDRATPHIGVNRVERHGPHLHQTLASSRFRVRQISELNNVRASRSSNNCLLYTS